MLASVIVFAAMLLNTLHCSSLLAGRRTSIFHSRLALQAGPERVADAPGGRSRGVDGHGNGNGSSDRGFQSGESQRGAPRERKFEPRDKRTNSADLAAVGTAAATAKDLDVWRTGDIFTKTPREREARCVLIVIPLFCNPRMPPRNMTHLPALVPISYILTLMYTGVAVGKTPGGCATTRKTTRRCSPLTNRGG